MGAFESGQTFIAGVLAKLPAEQRAQAEAIFNAAEAKDAVTLIGDSTLARADYSRSMDQLREKEGALTEYYTRLNDWYADNKAALDAGVRNPNPEPQLPADPARPSPAAPIQSPALTEADMRRLANDAINEAGRDYIAVSAFIAQQAGQHSHLFGEPLDVMELVNNPKLGKPILGQPGRVYSLQDAYQERYGDRLAAKQKEVEDKRFNEEVEKRYRERVTSQVSHPFPLRNESSPLDALQTKDGPAAHTLDTAVAEYERLQSARGT